MENPLKVFREFPKRAELVFLDHSFMSIEGTFDSVLIVSAIGGKEANHRKIAFSGGSLKNIGGKLQGLPHFELVWGC